MKIRSSLLLWLALVPGLVHALGLGNIQLESALNEPFRARIELLSTTVDDINSLNVSLAEEAAFRRSGIPRAPVLTQLEFSVKESDAGPDYILITSDDPIREPFLDFLVEVNWSKGRLYREYTVLLDPPVYIAEEMHKRVTPPPVTTATTGRKIREEEQTVIHYPEYKPAETPATAGTTPGILRPAEYTGGDYGPVASGETLWSIAREMRPDSSVSIQQMMLALLQANPEAFINSNINGLKRGHVLKAPDLSELQSLDKAAAFAQAQLQNSAWEEARQAAAMTPPVRPEGAPVQPEEPVVAAPVVSKEKPAEEAQETEPADVEGHPELRLVAPGEAGESATQGGEAEPGKEALTKELALARETLEALNLENTELKNKISDSDAIVSDLKRLITLKETELAALQQQVAKNAAKTETTKLATAATETPVKEAPPAPAQGATPKPEKKKEPSIVYSVLDAAAGLAAQLRNNLLYIAGALGVALAVFAGAYFVQRRRRETVQVQPGTYADFSEAPTIAAESEDSTDMNLAGGEQMGQEAITIRPGQSSETTQQVAGFPTAVESPKEAVTFEAAADSLEEVNVFLAYEHFDQAEEFVRNALEKEPDNLAYHVKLLEVYYTANNRKAYEQAARVLHDKVQGKGDYWGMALAMWQVLSPNRALFAAPAAGEEVSEAPAAKEAGGIVIITGDGEATSGGLDFDLDTTGGGAGTGDTLEEEASLEADVLDVTAAADTADSDILDVTSAADTSDAGAVVQETVAAIADDQGLEFSLELDDKGPEENQPLDISLDLLQEESAAPATPAGDDDQGLEFSLELDHKASEDQPLDISLGSLPGEGEAPAEPAGDENALDFSLDFEGPAKEDKAAMSQGSGAEPESGSDLLDVTAAIDIGDIAMDISGQSAAAQGTDLLDVTSATDFDTESGEDLLDVTFSGNVPVKGKEDDSALDFELAPDQPVPGNESAIAFDGIDITAVGGVSEQGLEPGGEALESEEDAFELDMDATMQIPTKRSSLSGKDEADSTLVVPRTSGGSQTDEDEIATQMDLAKAYIELGNADSAKTILDEIIVIGNDAQRRQAQELLGQIT